MRRTLFSFAIAVMIASTGSERASAEPVPPPPPGPPPHEDPAELEKKLANPLADLTTLPLQFNFNLNSANDDVSQTVFNIQPVFSGKVGEGSLLSRFILPYISQPVGDGSTSVSGFGDLVYQALYAPPKMGASMLGGGFLLQFPVGSAELSSRKWGLGPAVVFVYEMQALTMGGLATQDWSIGGSDRTKDVKLLTIQPFVSYRLGGGWSLNPLNNITYDGTLAGTRWTVPLGMSVAKLLVRRAVPINAVVGIFGNLVHPDGAPDWSLKFQMNFIY